MAVLLEVRFDGVGLPTLITNGRVEAHVLAYVSELEKDGASNSKLWYEATALYRFASFCEIYAPSFQEEELLRAFCRALQGEFPDLALNRISHKTARAYLEAVNRFGDWLCRLKKQPNPNPLVHIPLSKGQQALAILRERNISIIPQLAGRTASGTGYTFGRSFRTRSNHRSDGPRIARPRKVMSLESYNQLLSTEENLRNVLLWLLLGAAGRRVSEALQLFCSDIVIDRENGEARIIMADPRWGAIYLEKGRRMTREAYLRDFYGLRPRDTLPRSDGKRAGWKGMVPDENRDLWGEAIFMFPSTYARLFLRCHVAYSRIRGATGQDHPYYFINMDRNMGQPMTRSNVRQVLSTSCKRAAIPQPENPHSLRHCYGDTLANHAGLTIAEVQLLMRHRSYESTLVYSSPHVAAVKDKLRDAERRAPIELRPGIYNA